MEFKGGTYISQVTANLENACGIWVEALQTSEIKDMDENGRLQLAEDLLTENLIPVEGVRNTWCVSSLIDNELVLLHVVRTVA